MLIVKKQHLLFKVLMCKGAGILGKLEYLAQLHPNEQESNKMNHEFLGVAISSKIIVRCLHLGIVPDVSLIL